MRSVLFVCTANQCRSPMAMALFRQYVREMQPDTAWRIESAGVDEFDGYPASSGSQSVVRSRGMDLSSHISRCINRELLEPFDLILTMEFGHKEVLQAEFPDLAHRIYMLSEMFDEQIDVDDPIGKPLHAYEYTATLIEDWLNFGFPRILELTGSGEASGDVPGEVSPDDQALEKPVG